MDLTAFVRSRMDMVRRICPIWKLQKGSALRVDISSSNFPTYHVHPNTARVWSLEDEPQIAYNTVYFGGKTASKITLPIVK